MDIYSNGPWELEVDSGGKTHKIKLLEGCSKPPKPFFKNGGNTFFTPVQGNTPRKIFNKVIKTINEEFSGSVSNIPKRKKG